MHLLRFWIRQSLIEHFLRLRAKRSETAFITWMLQWMRNLNGRRTSIEYVIDSLAYRT